MPATDYDVTHPRIKRILDTALGLGGILTLGLFCLILGFPLDEARRDLVGLATRCILGGFVLQEVLRFLIVRRRFALLRSRRIEVLLATASILEIIWGDAIIRVLQHLGSDLAPATITLFYLGGAQLTLLASLSLRALRENRWLNGRTLSPGLVFTLSFALLIVVGTLLLKTPHATQQGISWIDALFVATSAVCVTGLSPVDISTVLTQHGQWVLLGLIQVGGLGIMTLTYFFAYFTAGGVSLRNRIGLQDLLSEENLSHVGTVLALIIVFTFGVELAGAFLIHAALAGTPQAPDNLPFFALFHSISAFCNAGFSTLSSGLADPRVQGERGFLSVIMLLIVLGGLGFPVVKNFWEFAAGAVKRRLGLRLQAPPRLTANSRIVLVTTTALLAGGTLLLWLTEFAFGRGAGVVAAESPWFTALFHSVTARTAGFNVTPVEALLPASAALMMFLMFVGGSPSSTAGGIKTSTLALAFLSLRRVLLGRRDIEAFGRRLPDDLANRALATLLVAMGFITAVAVSLCALHPELPAADLVFEAVSAVGTVGLSRALTPQLGESAKLVLVAAMLVGRIGVLTFLLGFITRRQPTGLRLPETNVVL